MKQKDLQETESKQIVLATYAMAAEALDIKTLSTLVMATPKTDITQSVGRILRMKHENPIIVDIIDTHDTFQNQWKLRKRFYKKANYKIVTSTSKKYTDMEATEWFTAFDPKSKSKKGGDDDDAVAKAAARAMRRSVALCNACAIRRRHHGGRSELVQPGCRLARPSVE